MNMSTQPSIRYLNSLYEVTTGDITKFYVRCQFRLRFRTAFVPPRIVVPVDHYLTDPRFTTLVDASAFWWQCVCLVRAVTGQRISWKYPWEQYPFRELGYHNVLLEHFAEAIQLKLRWVLGGMPGLDLKTIMECRSAVGRRITEFFAKTFPLKAREYMEWRDRVEAERREKYYMCFARPWTRAIPAKRPRLVYQPRCGPRQPCDEVFALPAVPEYTPAVNDPRGVDTTGL